MAVLLSAIWTDYISVFPSCLCYRFFALFYGVKVESDINQ